MNPIHTEVPSSLHDELFVHSCLLQAYSSGCPERVVSLKIGFRHATCLELEVGGTDVGCVHTKIYTSVSPFSTQLFP